ncbi:MAG: HD domain-containing protein [Sporomusaceae bacterium]|nr:HD domain-containing protein [Sporomusaceae bacterium]
MIFFEISSSIFKDIINHQVNWFTVVHIVGFILLLISVDKIRRGHIRQLSELKKEIDSTERNYTEKSNALTALLNNIPCAFATINADYSIRSVSAELMNFTGIIGKDILGEKCFDVFDVGKKCPNCPVERAFEFGKIQQNVKKLMTSKDKEIYIEQIAIPILDSEGEIEYVFEVVVDATEKMELQRQHDHLLIQTITALVNLIESRDQYTGSHSNHVRDIAVEIGKELGFDPKRLEELSFAAVLHDIGKIGSPEHLLNKPGRLTDEEYEIIKEHPAIGYKALHNVDSLKQVADIILDHHERVDGNGYPAGKKAEEISLSARILNVADVYEAITADRIYRKAMTEEAAINIMNDGRGTQFDAVVVDALIKVISRQN